MPPSLPDVQGVVPAHFPAWRELLHAYRCSDGDRHQIWQFAVELSALKEGGLTHTDVRWLVNHGLAEIAEESTSFQHRKRRFCPIRSLTIGRRTAVILTANGAEFMERQLRARERTPTPESNRAQTSGAPPPHESSPALLGKPTTPVSPSTTEPNSSETPNLPPEPLESAASGTRPHWDAARHQLRLGEALVKQFRRPAPTMEIILAAFEEEGWPPMIDDPLPQRSNENAKRRLHHAVRNLNTMQSPKWIHFYVNGRGEEIHWEHATKRRASTA